MSGHQLSTLALIRPGAWAVLILFVAAVSCSDDNGSPATETPATISGPLITPDGWEGIWEFDIEFLSCATGAIVMTESLTDTLCAGDTLGLNLVPLLDECPGYIEGDSLVFSAEQTNSESGCTIEISLSFGALRDGDTITGSGEWTATSTGACGVWTDLNHCQEIALTATRVGDCQ